MQKICIIVVLLGCLLSCLAWAQENTPDTKEEALLEKFWQKFHIVFKANDAERMQQLIKDNPATAEKLQQRLIELGKGTGEQSGQYRVVAEVFKQFQTGNFSVIFDNLNEEAQQACNTSNYQIALQKWEIGLEQARTLNDKHYISQFLGNIGVVYQYLGRYQEALRSYEQTLAIAREFGNRNEEGKILGNIGSIRYQYGQYPEALRSYEQVLAIFRELGDRSGEGYSLANIGNVYQDIGQYQEALHFYEQALTIVRELGDHRAEGNILGYIGIVYDRLGQYQEALHFYEQALTIARDIGDRRGEGSILGNIGVVYQSVGQYQEALRSYEQAFAIIRDIGDRRGEGSILGNIGVVYQSVGQYQEALRSYEQALTIARELGDRLGEENNQGNIGLVYDRLGQYQEALRSYEQALTIARELGDRHGEGTGLVNIGDVYKALGQYQEASETFRKGLDIAETIGAPDALWLAQRGLASVELKLNQFESAITHYEQALDTIETLRAGLEEKEQKLSFMRGKFYVYDELITLLQDQHKQYSDKSHDRKALEIFERKQGRLFLEEMGQSGARLFAGIPEEILQKELDLQNQLDATRKQLVDQRSKIITKQNKDLIQSLEQDEKTLLAGQNTLQDQIKTEYPDYYALRYPKPATLTILQQNILQPGELMLVYGVMQNQTILWAVSKDDFRLITLSINEDDAQQAIASFRAVPDTIIEAVNAGQSLKAVRLADDTLDEMVQAGYTLYQRLIPETVRPLLNDTQTLYIIPTGPLYGLPFEALVMEVPENDEIPHYLMQNHSITYLSSASLLKILRDAEARRKHTIEYPLLAFANPEYPETCQPIDNPMIAARTDAYLTLTGKIKCFRQHDELPETEPFVKSLAKILSVADDDALHLRADASRSTVLRFHEQQRLDDYRYLVFAAHAVAPDEVDPIRQPALVLAHPETDDYLTMADVFGLRCDADLIVLSACNTGRGEQIRGEGIMGLTRAFMYAGTPAVGVTLWSVDSQASSGINTRFFRHLKEGQPVAEALRQAKLELLTEAQEDEDLEHFRHPFFWAPFVVFGDGR